ncbi:MAG: PepSY-associated TM helix domain-containing protein [Planctomycetota bacterium]
MKFSKLNRLVHRWGSIAILVPTAVILLTGAILQLKKESAWIQPATIKGEAPGLSLSFDQLLATAKTVPESDVESWDDVDRLDVRPGKGMVKVRCKNRWEIQIDANNGEVLQVAFRRSDLIESLHDGSFFHDFVKLWVFFPTAIVLIVLWATGLYLFAFPYLAKRKNRKRRKSIAQTS